MPLYDYRCIVCGKVIEVRHGFSERFSEACAACGGALQRVFNPAPIVFKGSGFYVTDSRAKRDGKKIGDAKKGDDAKKGEEAAKPGGASQSTDATKPATPAPDPKPAKPSPEPAA